MKTGRETGTVFNSEREKTGYNQDHARAVQAHHSEQTQKVLRMATQEHKQNFSTCPVAMHSLTRNKELVLF